MSQGQGDGKGNGNGNSKGRGAPPPWSNAPDHVTEDDGGKINVAKRPDGKRREEEERLRDSVDWSNAPDWARLLHLEIEYLYDE